MKSIVKLITGSLLISLLICATPSALAAGVDIYLVYLGEDKQIKSNLKESLPGDLKIKTYNASLLSMADYSGKQKLRARLSSSRLVVLIKDKVVDALDNPDFEAAIVVNNAGQQELDRILSALK